MEGRRGLVPVYECHDPLSCLSITFTPPYLHSTSYPAALSLSFLW